MSEFAERAMDLFHALHPLDRVPRAGYLLRGVTEPESVSAHSHALALLALLFLDEYPDRWNHETTLSMALVHDLAESQLMDIPMPVADAHLRGVKREAEQAIFEGLFAGFPGRYAQLHASFADASTPEAKLLRGLDKAQMMIKVLAYQAEGRGRLAEFWSNPANFRDFGVPEVSDLFDAICRRAGRIRPE
jgi:putative hydrolase of HD superfamily